MPRVRSSVIYGDNRGKECDALAIAVHEDTRDIIHPWLSVVIVEPNRDAEAEVQGVRVRQTTPIVKVPHKMNAGPGHYWREKE